MGANTLQRISWSGSSGLKLACKACGREGEPMRRVGYGDSQLPISQLWRAGKLVCACGGPGDHLAVRSAPAGMAPRVLALWRWGDGGLWPSPEPDSGARLRYTSAMLATATTDRWAALLVREPR